MGAMMFSTMFGGGLIPTYMLNKSLGLVNNPLVLILPGAMSVHNMIIARTFIDGIPHELEEAAHIDGCSDFKFFFNCVIPLSKTVMAVLCLYYAVGHWNSYFSALLYINVEEIQPLQLYLRKVLTANNSQSLMDMGADEMARAAMRAETIKYSVIVVSSIPMLILYPFVQKFFVKGVMIGAVKG
jgi:putative aldouronate transport system permease protein